MSIGENIHRLRKAKGMTQAELAEKLDVSFQAVSSWERGENTPDTDKLLPLALVLDTTAGALLDGQGMTWPLQDRLFDEERMYTFIQSAALSRNLPQTLIALPYARQNHLGQARKGSGNVPYINHPLTMVCHALAMGIDEDEALAALLLHDVAEDCGIAPEDMPVNKRVQHIVRLVTKEADKDYDDPAMQQQYYDAIAQDGAACLVKLIDRCNNLSMMAAAFSWPKLASYMEETEQYILPLMEQIKNTSPQYNNARFLLKYQMLSLMETVKRLL